MASKFSDFLHTALKRIAKPQSKWLKFKMQQKDALFGRERIGVDRYGNKYYQYYSFHGLPTKRVVLYRFFDTNKFHQDPHFLGWLRRNEILPPTPEELERLYLEHDSFLQRGIEWDKREQAAIDEFNRQKELLDKEYDRAQLQGEAEAWVPGTKPKQLEDGGHVSEASDLEDEEAETTEIAAISEIDKLEEMYFEEYQRVLEKDKERNKDGNKRIYEQARITQYFFAYLRSQEKLAHLERLRLEKEEAKFAAKSMTALEKQKKEEEAIQAENLDRETVMDQVLGSVSQPNAGIRSKYSYFKYSEREYLADQEKIEARAKALMKKAEKYRSGLPEEEEKKKPKKVKSPYNSFREEFGDVFESVYGEKK